MKKDSSISSFLFENPRLKKLKKYEDYNELPILVKYTDNKVKQKMIN